MFHKPLSPYLKTMAEVPQWFQDELLRIGGRAANSFPNLRAVHGESEQTFACGQYIPKYRTGQVKETKTKLFRLRDINTNEVTPCSYGEAKDAWEGKLGEGCHSEAYEHLVLEPIGLDRFVVEQYIPPEKIKDTPEGWEANRYAMFSLHPSMPETRTDMIGPFPVDGRYEGFLTVKEDDGTRFGKPRELGWDVIKEVEELWSKRNAWKQTKSVELMAKDIFDAAREKERKDERETTERLNAAILPHSFTGAYMYNPPKKNEGRRLE